MQTVVLGNRGRVGRLALGLALVSAFGLSGPGSSFAFGVTLFTGIVYDLSAAVFGAVATGVLAVAAIGGPRVTDAVEPLIGAFGDQEADADVRAAARAALDTIDDPRAFEAVGPAAGDHYAFTLVMDHPDDPRLNQKGSWEGTIVEVRFEGKGAPEAQVRVDTVEGHWVPRWDPGEAGSVATVSLPLPVGAEHEDRHPFWRADEPDADGHYAYHEEIDQASRF